MSIILILQMRGHRLIVRLTRDDAREHAYSLTFLKQFCFFFKCMKLSPCEDSEIIYSSVVSYLHPRSLERAPYSSDRLYLTHFSPAAWPVGTAPQRTLSASLGSLKSTSEAGEVVKDLFLTLSRQATCPPTEHPGPSGVSARTWLQPL